MMDATGRDDRPEPPGRHGLLDIDDSKVRIPVDSVGLLGSLIVPPDAAGVVLFAHGSGSGRFSPRNVRVARTLRKARMGTLLFDLLTEDESRSSARAFDVALMAARLRGATNWTRGLARTTGLPIGYFGASTGAAAAFLAAADDPDIAGVVSRGGRPDLAGPALARVRAPTLLVVGGADTAVAGLNERAFAELRCDKRLVVVPGATHRFEEPGALEEVTSLATDWFWRWFRRGLRAA
jgi:putative phosphoribosyl transferase